MSEILGKLITCNRCENTHFQRRTGSKDLDGGWTHLDTYEKLPEDWLYESEFGHLCPSCSRMFKILMTDFFGDKCVSKWRVETEDTECKQN